MFLFWIKCVMRNETTVHCSVASSAAGLAHPYNVAYAAQPQTYHCAVRAKPAFLLHYAKISLWKQSPLSAYIIIAKNVCLYFNFGIRGLVQAIWIKQHES